MAFYVGLSAGIFLQEVTSSCSSSSHPTLYWTTLPNHVCVNVFSGCASWWNRAWTQRTVRLPSAASWRTCMTSTPPAVTSRTSSARFSGRIQFSTIWGYFFVTWRSAPAPVFPSVNVNDIEMRHKMIYVHSSSKQSYDFCIQFNFRSQHPFNLLLSIRKRSSCLQ